MIINSAPQNEAILSNVGEVGEFRIRNSAKAFKILSDGLYANKIRAIIRELSCNAVDSHVAAGKADVPFSVHLPNQLEPWFSIRDYGTGLDHEQVTSIYTTYFESTKTDSNDFIGALGLGSKSPFSYSDNFTVTAIKNGRKGIYTAFINEQGVPSIALMSEEQTDEPAGVEIQFAVENKDRYEFSKFAQEAADVYSYFKLQPTVTGKSDFTVNQIEYQEKDIVPGIHQRKSCRGSVAIMGNIAYPIEVPNAEANLGTLASLLGCSLEIHFNIGELDFQASREGLSYIPSTIEAIKARLTTLNDSLTGIITAQADAIENLWERALFLKSRDNNPLWVAAVTKYATDTKFELYNVSTSRYNRLKTFAISVEDLAKTYNIVLSGFNKYRGDSACRLLKPETNWSSSQSFKEWRISIQENVKFVKNDTKVGATERAKFHYKNCAGSNSVTVWVMGVADKTQPAKFDEFIEFLSTPPEIVLASTLDQRERASGGSAGQPVTILRMEKKYSDYRRRSDEMVWRPADELGSYDSKNTYYYLPLSGYNLVSKYGSMLTTYELKEAMTNCGIGSLEHITVYGVRKADLDAVKLQKNWVNLEDHIANTIKTLSEKTILGMVVGHLDKHEYLEYNKMIADKVTDPDSEYLRATTLVKGVERKYYSEHSYNKLAKIYGGASLEVFALVEKYRQEFKTATNKYPLLAHLRSSSARNEDVAEYINLIDIAKKGI